MLKINHARYDSFEIKSRANGMWPDIFSNHGIDVPPTPNKHGPCPACGGVDRFRFDDKDGDGCYICSQCGAGDGFSLLMKCFDWTFPQALEAVATYSGTTIHTSPSTKPHNHFKTPTFDKNKQQRINTTLANSKPTGLALERYLINRGLNNLIGNIPSCLSFHPGLPYWQETPLGKWEQIAICPAMLGLVTDLTGKIITLHRTFLTQDGKKASLPHPKKLMSPALPSSTRGCSIKLGIPTETLYLTEGIETALAVMLSTNDAVWACVSATLLEQAQIPKHVTTIFIMADKDRSKTGEQSAYKLAQRLLKERNNITVKICLPPMDINNDKKSIDWLDVYNIKQWGAIK